MADTKTSALTAVTTPVSTDEFVVAQSGTSKKMTRAQVHALESGQHLILPQVNEPSTPTISMGDGDSGFYENADDNISLAIAGSEIARFNASFIMRGSASGYAAVTNELSSATNPAFAFVSDDDTGIGRSAADALSLIAGAIEAVRYTEASNDVIVANDNNVGLTADVGSAQGNGVITSSYNVYSTVGTAGDAATLPATFVVGTTIYVKNDAATNSMDVFPASGDDAGAGANTAVAVAAGDFAVFFATAASATWTKLMGGTA